MCEELFGPVLHNSDNRTIPTRYIGEQHVLEDLGKIPSMMDWYKTMKLERWMVATMTVADVVHDKLMVNIPVKLELSK